MNSLANLHWTIGRKLAAGFGLVCATFVVALVDAILFAAYPKASWHVIPNLCLVKLYFNSMLVSLNSRRRVAPLAQQDDQHYHIATSSGVGWGVPGGWGGSDSTLHDAAKTQGHKQAVQGVQVVTQ